MQKKVFASDFDGTLYFYKAEVKLPPENVEKIREYQAAGHLFGLCTEPHGIFCKTKRN